MFLEKEMQQNVCLLFVAAFCLIPLCRGEKEKVDHGAAAHKSNHYHNGIHNSVFDQEALLGSRDFDELQDLPDDVRVSRLKTLAKSHDANNNDIIEAEELEQWIIQSFQLLDREEALDKFKDDDENKDGKVTFAEIMGKMYGYTEEDLKNVENAEKPEDDADVMQMVTDDKKRFGAADVNKDGFLDESEYYAYFQPYDYPHMFPSEMERTMKEFDKDSDGFVSMEEFIGEELDEETRLSEVTNFEDLDKDKDGKLTSEEMRPWVLPDNNDVAKEEVEHLVQTCDENADGHLSIEEIVKKEDEFLSSSATDYGRNLHFVRDEL